MSVFRMLKNFFCNMRCGQCGKIFEESSASILREEENCVVLRITCCSCEKNLGIALMGFDQSLKLEDDEDSTTSLSTSSENCIEECPISYDDVIEAHNFFYNLDKDWSKYLQKPKSED
ncbi:MAG: hypothetical protein WCK67_06265 [bacterium]